MNNAFYMYADESLLKGTAAMEEEGPDCFIFNFSFFKAVVPHR